MADEICSCGIRASQQPQVLRKEPQLAVVSQGQRCPNECREAVSWRDRLIAAGIEGDELESFVNITVGARCTLITWNSFLCMAAN
jgi:hypothetical protein